MHENTHGAVGPYKDQCPDCALAYSRNQNSTGCKEHHFDPRLRRTGNVCKATLVQDTTKRIHRDSAHKVQGACQLLPGDVRLIRDYCISSNDNFLFELFVCLLTSIELFLRKMEFSHLHEDSFNTHMSVMSGDFLIEALNLKVDGKRKRTKNLGPNDGPPTIRYLYLWGDDLCPDLDLKRHLLAYLYAIGWKGGYLFPSKKELESPPPDGVYQTYIQEHELYSHLHPIYKKVLKRSDPLGVHTGRKSAYLWGHIRGGPIAELMLAADHDCYEVAVRYDRDASSITSVNRIYQQSEQLLGNFRSPYCKGDENAARSCAPGSQWQKPLVNLVYGFIEHRVGVQASDPRRLTPTFLYEKVRAWRAPAVAPSQNLEVSLICFPVVLPLSFPPHVSLNVLIFSPNLLS